MKKGFTIRMMIFLYVLMMVPWPIDSACPMCSGDCRSETVDLTFVIDGSGSICEDQEVSTNCKHWKSTLNFVAGVVDNMNVSQNGDRIAVVQFSNDARKEFGLDMYTNTSSVKAAILGVSQMAGNTNTSGGLYVMRSEVFSGSSGDRPDIPNVAIVITDGKSTYDTKRTLPEAKAARDAGVKIYVVGVTSNIDVVEVAQISSAPQALNTSYFFVPNFNGFTTLKFVESVHKSVCKQVQLDNKDEKCPGTYFSGGCYIVTKDLLSRHEAEAECQITATSVGRPGMGHLVAIPNSIDQEIMSWLVRSFWEKNPRTKFLKEFWVGGYQESEDFNGDRYATWRWLQEPDKPMEIQGCFTDNPSSPDLDGVQTEISKMTPQKCIDYCTARNFLYAGVQNGVLCSCGNSYGRYGRTSGCVTPCSGSNADGKLCGGRRKNSIYVIGGRYSNWALGQPDSHGGQSTFQICGALEGRDQWRMGDEACFKSYQYICRLPVSYCPALRLSYMCVFVSKTPRTWFDARADCHKRNGDLLTIESSQMHHEVKGVLPVVGIADVFYWVGFIGKEWRWSSGDVITPYTNWAADEPNQDGHNCMRMAYNNSDGTFAWKDGVCSELSPSLCFIDMITPVLATPPTPAILAKDPTTVKTSSASATSAPSNDTVPNFGASTAAGGISVVEIVVIVVLVLFLLVGLVVGIVACYYHKKGKEDRVVYPQKEKLVPSNVLVPYSSYYDGNDFNFPTQPPPTPPRSTYQTNWVVKNQYYVTSKSSAAGTVSETKKTITSGLVMNANRLNTSSVPADGYDHARISFTTGQTTGFNEDRTTRRSTRRSERYSTHVDRQIYETVDDGPSVHVSRRSRVTHNENEVGRSRDRQNVDVSLSGARISMD